MPKKIDLPVLVENPGLRFNACSCVGFVPNNRDHYCSVCGHDGLDHRGDGPCSAVIASRDDGPTWEDVIRSTNPGIKALITNITTPEGY